MYYQRPLVYRILESFFRHRRLFFAAFLTIIILITAYVVTRPASYIAQYTVVLNSETITNPITGVGATVDWNTVNQTAGHFQTLIKTRDFLQSALQNPDGTPIKLNRPIDFDDQAQVTSVQNNINVYADGEDAFVVGISYADPEDVITILKALISTFIERNAEEKSSYYTEQVAFITGQLQEYQNRLQAAESQLANFKQENAMHLPSEQEAIEQQLVNLGQQIQQYKLQLAEDQDQEKVLEQQVATTPKTIVAEETKGYSLLDIELKNLEIKLDQYTTVYGMKPNHPQVIATIAQIKRLQKQMAEKTKSGSADANEISSSNIQPNPQYQFLDNQLVQLRINEMGLKTEISNSNGMMAQTRSGVAKVPEEERVLANLERDYAFNSDTYGVLQHRLQESTLNEQLNLRQQRGMYNLYLTSPAQSTTSKSKTAMLFAGGIVVAIVVGIGLVLLSEGMDRSFRDPFEMQRSLGVPVLAILPESADLHVADSRTPQLPGPGVRKRLGRSGKTPLLNGPAKAPAASVAAATDTENRGGAFGSPGLEAEPTAGAGGAV